jgi:hypothetical protein
MWDAKPHTDLDPTKTWNVVSEQKKWYNFRHEKLFTDK